LRHPVKTHIPSTPPLYQPLTNISSKKNPPPPPNPHNLQNPFLAVPPHHPIKHKKTQQKKSSLPFFKKNKKMPIREKDASASAGAGIRTTRTTEHQQAQ
jgi:hypothetical protein